MSQKLDSKTGKWFYYGAYVDDQGLKHQYKKRGFNSKREASKAEDKFRDDVDSGKIIRNKKTFSIVSDEYNKWIKKRIKESTYISNKQSLDKIKKELPDKPIDKITSEILQTYIDELDSKYSERYVEKLYYNINKVFNYAFDHNYILYNPLQKVKRDARKNVMKKEMEFWEPHQFNKFIKCVDDTLYILLFSFLYYMGTRRGETLALQWKDVDLKNKSVTINKTVSYKVSPYTITPPKTKNSIRTISLPLTLYDLLIKHKNEQKTLYGFTEERYIFGYTRPLPPETIRRSLHNFIDLTNSGIKKEEDTLPKIRIHDLRHSHASYLINNKSTLFTDYDIAKRLGDTVQTLHETYAHWFKSADKGIIKFMDKDINN